MLAVAALALLASFVASSVATFNLRSAARTSSADIAEGLAKSAVQQALAEVQGDLGYASGVTLDGASLGLPPGSRGDLTFNKDAGIAYSTNNFLGKDPTGWNRPVPDKTIHLVGRGECGGVVKHHEVVVHLPEFPVAMACDGPVDVRNSFIGGFDPEDDRPWEPGKGYDVKQDEVTEGHLISNNQDPNAVVLDVKTRVMGDVQARGAVQLHGAEVRGEVRERWGQRAPLPVFELAKFDPANSKNLSYEELSFAAPALRLTGNVRAPSSLSLTGDLTLDNAFLFVNGDLTVRGGVRGVGAVVVSGKAVFEGANSVVGAEQIAILTGGGVEIEGDGAERSVFQGLIYTKGPFSARKITVVGGFMVDNGSPTVITDSNVYFSERTVSPVMKRQVFAVVPRFFVPGGDSRAANLTKEMEGKFPIGTWIEKGRNVSNVIDIEAPDFLRSNWDMDDPAVISIKWVNDEPLYRYEFWGNADAPGVKQGAAHSFWHFGSGQELADYVADMNTASNVHEHLNGTPPDRNAYRDYLLQVTQHLSQELSPEVEENFTIDANEFVGDPDTLRVLYRRTF